MSMTDTKRLSWIKRVDTYINMLMTGQAEMYGQSVVEMCCPEGVYASVLGKGYEGIVLKIHHRILKRFEAVKIRKNSSSVEARDRFERQAGILGMIEAMCREKKKEYFFPRIYDCTSRPGVIRMEYLEGKTLLDYIKDNDIDKPTKICLIRDLAEGLSHLHGFGVIHRDVKPANVIITKEGVPKWVDFGFAKRESDIDVTHEGKSLGTVKYSAPEQLSDAATVNASADVYAFNKLIYFVMTGNEQFDPQYLPHELMMFYTTNAQSNPKRRMQNAGSLLKGLQKIYPDYISGGLTDTEDYVLAAFRRVNSNYGYNTGKVKKILKAGPLTDADWNQLVALGRQVNIREGS